MHFLFPNGGSSLKRMKSFFGLLRTVLGNKHMKLTVAPKWVGREHRQFLPIFEWYSYFFRIQGFSCLIHYMLMIFTQLMKIMYMSALDFPWHIILSLPPPWLRLLCTPTYTSTKHTQCGCYKHTLWRLLLLVIILLMWMRMVLLP